MSAKKILLIVLGSILGIIALFITFLYYILAPLEKTDNKIIKREIVFQETNKVLYVETQYRGITGDYEEIILSEFPIEKQNRPDKQTDYVFYTSEIFYKKDKNGKIFIFAPQSGKNIPEIPFKNIEVVFIGLKTADEIRDYETNYRKYGLQRISIYDKDG